jgi:hypothetical protein
MTRLEHLTQFSNAVLSPELNTCVIPMKKHVTYRATDFESNNSELKTDEIAFRKNWCEQQISLIGKFGAVIEVAA